MVKLVNDFVKLSDLDQQKAAMAQYQKLHTENIYTLGVIIGRYALGMSKRLKNVPIGTPAFFYQWDYNNFIPEQMFVATADQGQVPETKPDTLPEFPAS